MFSMAVQTVMLVATYFGAQEIQWAIERRSTIGLIICILIIQLVAVVGAFLTSRASAKFGNIPTLNFLNIILAVLLCSLAFFITLPMHFYVMATIAGFVMGGIQALYAVPLIQNYYLKQKIRLHFLVFMMLPKK